LSIFLNNIWYQPTTPIPTNPKFLQFQQQHLRLLLHAHCCHRDQMTSEGCTIPNCDEAKSLLRHMEECRREEDCERDYCTISKDLIAHWRKCKDEKCIVCAPVIFIPSQQPDQPDPIFTSQSSEVGGLATNKANLEQQFDVLWSQLCTMFEGSSETIKTCLQPFNDDEFVNCPSQSSIATSEGRDWRVAFDDEVRGYIIRLM
uniref:histone acetyltransferase n=1 Tax=Taenia asiatica TaxID=60517 RepID=A0A0R3WC39_TAEAS